MLKNDITEPSNSNWASPGLLVPKHNGSVRFYTDYRKVNALGFLLLLPLTGYTSRVMPFDMKNSQATFQRMMNE